ncbi:hypothetical protein M3661_28350 [Paenibacillus sp. MER 180]|uniref:hypothetical protein n=1 Tax=Paenibacillus sp. MER 180 TaxID=2939570 RepID=UPI00203F6254|nr:hypothetical protein [Paenibacillus sp. MER 180]MCM3294012.1 hypothetical protein [Paenibacillus sp. MER 180]
MSPLEDVQIALNNCVELDEKGLKELQKILCLKLESIKGALKSSSKKPQSAHPDCPNCSSSNIKAHTKNPVPRFFCIDCKITFTRNRQPLFYRRKNRDKIIDLIVLIYTTDKSITEIIEQLDISEKTYYEWRKQILLLFPQLQDKFQNRRKK